MISITKDTEIRESKKRIDEFNEFADIWESVFAKHIHQLIIFCKFKKIDLDTVKIQVRQSLESILNKYHSIELYHTIQEDNDENSKDENKA